MNIRLEKPEDYRIVEELTREAFWNKYRPGCSEHFVLHGFRTSPRFIPQLDCVLEDDGVIVGHIMYAHSEITLPDGTSFPVGTFGPVSIAPARQGEGLGSYLIRQTQKTAADMGIGAIATTGNPDYYHRFGFDSASKMGVRYYDASEDEEAPYFMLLELKKGYLDGIKGVYRDPEEYFVRDEDVEAFDKTFTPKQKLKLPTQIFG